MVFSRRHFVPNPVSLSTPVFSPQCKPPRFLHTRYDDEGNRTFRYVDADSSDTLNTGDTDITEYTWDHRNRLTAVEHFSTWANYDAEASDQLVSYTYDCFNRLIKRVLDPDGASGATAVEQSVYVYEAGQIVAQFDKTGSGDLAATDMSHRYLWNPQAVDQLLADEQIHYDSGFVTEELLFTLTDHLNSVRDGVTYDEGKDSADLRIHRVFDAFGRMTDEDLYDPAGNPVSPGQFDTLEELFGYTGKLFDEATGHQYNWNNWYDAATGRWLAEDKAFSDPNLTRYVGNAPLTNVDPTGLCKEDGGSTLSDLVYRGGEKPFNFQRGLYRPSDYAGMPIASYVRYNDLMYRGEAPEFSRGIYRPSDYVNQTIVQYLGFNDLMYRGEAPEFSRGLYRPSDYVNQAIVQYLGFNDLMYRVDEMPSIQFIIGPYMTESMPPDLQWCITDEMIIGKEIGKEMAKLREAENLRKTPSGRWHPKEFFYGSGVDWIDIGWGCGGVVMWRVFGNKGNPNALPGGEFNPGDAIQKIPGARIFGNFNDAVAAQRKAGGGTIVAIQGYGANYAILMGTPGNWYWEYANLSWKTEAQHYRSFWLRPKMVPWMKDKLNSARVIHNDRLPNLPGGTIYILIPPGSSKTPSPIPDEGTYNDAGGHRQRQ